MKKIIAFTLVVILALSMSACARRTNTAEPVKYQTLYGMVGTPDEVVSSDKYEDTLEGLCAYMKDKNCLYALPATSGDEYFYDPVTMFGSAIGADKGYKFTYEYDGKNIVTEVYSYSDTENKWYQQAKNEGKITLSEEIENGTFYVTLSDNGKYLMIYNDSANRVDREALVTEVFKSFNVR